MGHVGHCSSTGHVNAGLAAFVRLATSHAPEASSTTTDGALVRPSPTASRRILPEDKFGKTLAIDSAYLAYETVGPAKGAQTASSTFSVAPIHPRSPRHRLCRGHSGDSLTRSGHAHMRLRVIGAFAARSIVSAAAGRCIRELASQSRKVGPAPGLP